MDKKNNLNVLTSELFISQLRKIKKLNETGVYSDEEYDNRKQKILLDLTNTRIFQNYEDFLSDILVLKEENILILKEINQIKNQLLTTTKLKMNTLVRSSDDDCYLCANCGIEVELNENEILKNEFICPNCSTKNYLAEANEQNNHIKQHKILKDKNSNLKGNIYNKENNVIKNNTLNEYANKYRRREKNFIYYFIYYY